MPEVFVGMGSNVDPERALKKALSALRNLFARVDCSAAYRSVDALGRGASYVNAVAKFATERGVDEVREVLASVELAAGRSRNDATVCHLDIDILLYGSLVDAARRVPRPGAFSTSFVAVPLGELAPWGVHPLTGERFADLAARALAPTLSRLSPIDGGRATSPHSGPHPPR